MEYAREFQWAMDYMGCAELLTLRQTCKAFANALDTKGPFWVAYAQRKRVSTATAQWLSSRNLLVRAHPRFVNLPYLPRIVHSVNADDVRNRRVGK